MRFHGNACRSLPTAFQRECERTTEFHFEDLTTQLEAVRAEATADAMPGATGAASSAVASGTRVMCSWRRVSSPQPTRPRGGGRGGTGERWVGAHAGDVVITTHSNLPLVHVVFHVVTDLPAGAAGGLCASGLGRAARRETG